MKQPETSQLGGYCVLPFFSDISTKLWMDLQSLIVSGLHAKMGLFSGCGFWRVVALLCLLPTTTSALFGKLTSTIPLNMKNHQLRGFLRSRFQTIYSNCAF